MNKPYLYTILCDKTKEVLYETNNEPCLRDLQTWEQQVDGKSSILKQTKTCYKDMRYKAKLRLYNYVTYTKNGLDVTKDKLFFSDSEIGKNIPILNF